MTLSRTEVTPGLIAELEAFGALLASLDDQAWEAPTRCEGWSVADTSAHVVGSVADVVAGRLEGLGSPEVTAREVAERRGRSAADLAQELSEVTKLAGELAAAFDDAAWEMPAPGGYDGTLGQGVEAIWYDTYLHSEDVRAALGRPAGRGPGLRAGVHHVASELESAIGARPRWRSTGSSPSTSERAAPSTAAMRSSSCWWRRDGKTPPCSARTPQSTSTPDRIRLRADDGVTRTFSATAGPGDRLVAARGRRRIPPASTRRR